MLFLSLLLFSTATSIEAEVPEHKLVFNPNFYKDALDKELCHKQMQYIINSDHSLLWKLADAGIRTPRGLQDGNTVDLGNYYQCLSINDELISTSSTIEGKYCSIRVTLPQEVRWPYLPEFSEILKTEIPYAELNSNISLLRGDKHDPYKGIKGNPQRISSSNPLNGKTLILAVCIPKTCTTQQVLTELNIDATEIGLNYSEQYCRLPNDKQWVVADYLAISIFSLFGLLLIASTSYDIYQTVVLEEAPKSLNQIYKSFSIYTNSRQLVNYKPEPGTIECLDGIRCVSMIWIVTKHTFFNQLWNNLLNAQHLKIWFTYPQALLITMGDIAVETFLLLSGLLLVYTNIRKMTRSTFLRSLHIFYLRRITRILPILATMVLLQASILNRISDGPDWKMVKQTTEICRVYWWSTILFINNWVYPDTKCLEHSWYLSIDMQLYLLSPLVLYWVIDGSKRSAWISLASAATISLVGATFYNFYMDFPSVGFATARKLETMKYFNLYYVNTFTRSLPFIIGMIYGYILHLHRNEKFQMSNLIRVLWICAFLTLGAVTWINYPILQLDWDNHFVDNLINSFMRPLWSLAVGWIVLACHNGHGGPINWFLSLRCFKVLSRLSFAMYMVHFPLIYLVNGSQTTISYFTLTGMAFILLADFTLALIVSYLVTMLVDAPCTNLLRCFLNYGNGPKPKENK